MNEEVKERRKRGKSEIFFFFCFLLLLFTFFIHPKRHRNRDHVSLIVVLCNWNNAMVVTFILSLPGTGTLLPKKPRRLPFHWKWITSHWIRQKCQQIFILICIFILFIFMFILFYNILYNKIWSYQPHFCLPLPLYSLNPPLPKLMYFQSLLHIFGSYLCPVLLGYRHTFLLISFSLLISCLFLINPLSPVNVEQMYMNVRSYQWAYS